MSFEDDLKKLGDDVSNLVDNAINSQNFQQLNQKITDSINQLVYPRKNRSSSGYSAGRRTLPAAGAALPETRF